MTRNRTRLVVSGLAMSVSLCLTGAASAMPADPDPSSASGSPTGARRDAPGHGLAGRVDGATANVAVPPGYSVLGIDATSWQHPNGQAINWGTVASSGYSFATVKATEGNWYTNPYYVQDQSGALSKGIASGPYHFWKTVYYENGQITDRASGAEQAAFFIQKVKATGYTGKRAGDLPVVLDLEWDWQTNKCPVNSSVTEVRAFLDAVESAFGRTPMIYTSRTFINGCMGGTTALGRYLLQVAYYSSSAPSPPLPPGFSTWQMWQFVGSDTVPGVPAGVTRNVFNKTQADLDRLANRSGSYTVWGTDVNVRQDGAACKSFPSTTNCTPVIDTLNPGDRLTPICQKQGQQVESNPYWVYAKTSHDKTGWLASWWIDYPANQLPGVPIC